MKLRIVNNVYLGPGGSFVKVENLPEKLKGDDTTKIRINWLKVPESRFIPKGSEYSIVKVASFVPEEPKDKSDFEFSLLRYSPKPAYVEVEFATGPFKSMRFQSGDDFVLPTFNNIQQRFAGIFHFYSPSRPTPELQPNGFTDPLADGRRNNAVRGLCNEAWKTFKSSLPEEDEALATATNLTYISSPLATLASSNVKDGLPTIEISDGFLNEVWNSVYVLSQPGHPEYGKVASRHFAYIYEQYAMLRTGRRSGLTPDEYANSITSIMAEMPNAKPAFRDNCFKSAMLFVLAHEFGHIRENDPTIAAASKDIARTRERKADQYALERMMDLKLCPVAALFSINSVTTLETTKKRGVFLYPSLVSRAKMILRATEKYFMENSNIFALPTTRLASLERINELLYLVQINLDAQLDDSYE